MAPIDLFRSLKGRLFKLDAEKDLPAIAPRYAAGLSIAYTLLYVLPFYLSSTTRPSPHLSRDAPSVIRARIRAVTLSCILSTLGTYYVTTTWGHYSILDSLHLLGYWPLSLLDIAKSVLLTAVLFAGPLFESGIVEGGWRTWLRGQRMRESLGGWIGWRNYVAGPITEEVVFRSTLVPLHILAKVCPTRIIFFTPLYFGIAHIHHFYEFSLTHPHTPLLPALVRSLVQFAYTSLFGFYATFVYLRTGSTVAVVLSHSFCNWCGLPRVWGRVEAGVPLGPPVAETEERRKAKDDGPNGVSTVQVADGRLGIGWTVAYYILLVSGAIGFWQGLWVLTESNFALVKVGGFK
ncbi:MAG: hypothetical protein M1817_006570 [Caeruleum heppii]|nr:MAG: hypothetical protein M1817_006570 [Caeruleum heppii]